MARIVKSTKEQLQDAKSLLGMDTPTWTAVGTDTPTTQPDATTTQPDAPTTQPDATTTQPDATTPVNTVASIFAMVLAGTLTPDQATAMLAALQAVPSNGTPVAKVATTVSSGALSLSRVQRGVPYSGFIRLTGASYHANPNSDRGRAWATLQDGGNVAEWCRVAKAAGNKGCGVGDIEILAGKWGAVVVCDQHGIGLYPASAIGQDFGPNPTVKW